MQGRLVCSLAESYTPGMSSNWRHLYPFASHTIRCQSWRYHYVDEGNGPPLLMVHGNPTWSFYWRNLIAAWRDQHRTIAVDHLGCGLSDKPQSYPYSLETHTANLVQLIDELDLRDITLLAHDWGGAIGLGAAVARPERFRRFVLFNTAAFTPPYIPWRIRACRLPVIGTWAIRRLNLFARAAISMAVEKPLAPNVKAGLLAPYDSWDSRIAIQQFVADIPGSRHHPTWRTLEKLEQSLATLSGHPMQIIWGKHDWCFRMECLERLRDHFPSAQVDVLDDAGHYVVEDAHPSIISTVDDFLRQATP